MRKRKPRSPYRQERNQARLNLLKTGQIPPLRTLPNPAPPDTDWTYREQLLRQFSDRDDHSTSQ